MPDDDWRSTNLANWNERVAFHAASGNYRVEQIATDPDVISGVVDFDRQLVGDATGKRAGVAARWYFGDLYDAPQVIGDETFDLVYTGVGAIGWLPDIRGWAQVVGHFVAPGGSFFIRECHPVLSALDYDDPDRLSIIFPYFETAEPTVFDEDGTYVDRDASFEHNRTVEWIHGLAETIQALLDAGLVLDDVGEHTFTDWQPFDRFQKIDERYGHWALPEDIRSHLPTMFHLKMHRPA